MSPSDQEPKSPPTNPATSLVEAQREIALLRERIGTLAEELADREKDLSVFRSELRSANQRIESMIVTLAAQLRQTGQIQRLLVPTEIAAISGFDFSSKFVASPLSGGDYYDIFELDDRLRFGLVLSCASGYSISSLFLTVLLKVTGQTEARRGQSPERVIELIAQEVAAQAQAREKAHLFYGLVDRRSFQLQYVSLGEIVALHGPAEGGRMHRLKAAGQALESGLQIPSGGWPVQTIDLSPRDRLIICSQGVARARNRAGEEFGEDRLYRAVLAAPRQGVHDLRNEILYQVERFCEGTDLPADVTVVVAEVKDKIIKLA